MSAELIHIVKHKTCTKCGKSKPYSEYHQHSKGGLQPRCKECRNTDYRNGRGNDADKRKTVFVTEDGRSCLICKETKPWDKFAKDVHGFNQKTATCKLCRNKKSLEKYPDKRGGEIKNRPDRVMRLYGITYEHVIRTLDAQHGLCANRRCGKEISLDTKGVGGNRAVIDHNHKTGKFRALLCAHCNSTLGLIETKKNMLIGLAEYLTEYSH